MFQIMALITLILIPLIVLRTLTNPSDLVTQPQLIGIIFIVICVLGAIVGVRPTSFSRSVSSKSTQGGEDKKQVPEELKEKSTVRGHHYSCDSFSDHVIRIGSNVYCVGCTGLTTGAMIAILVGLAYFLLGVSIFDDVVVFWVGFAGVFIGLVQHQFYRLFSIRNGFFRFSLNVVFVVGASLLLVGSNRIAGDLIVDLYIICVILLWIITRIVMSKGEHERICRQCDVDSCSHQSF